MQPETAESGGDSAEASAVITSERLQRVMRPHDKHNSGETGTGPDANSRTLPRFMSVSSVARMFGISDVTLYRAIAAGEFPAVRIRGRLIVPTRAIEAMAEAATSAQAVVDAATWNPEDADR